jgi:RNA polymerase sigma factor for flagellar operon FliA
VYLYYTGDLTMKEIGDVLGVNESRVSQIHKSALRRMAAALESEGIHSPRAF